MRKMKLIDQKIYDDFPWVTVMFECTQEWLPLIHGAFSEIENYCDENKIDYPCITQVKEKYNTLRIYLGSYEEKYEEDYENIDKIIKKYQLASVKYSKHN